ncbi:YbaB/EbfC family nucleoid-associated protein [Tabrizicola sp.]|uniref:YbaB/EbfC family nucleoid-associated protein n=1 Tax=Tabrizicola sp. TaxID=2005166 RepID=UPI001A3A36A3|nr:YbaB/EbfC family nucleoid-associated protein [Tabrizicola sp.]MBL9062701.1 YbaB/EbfC family nucleoid-associated protein [Tabrizicola sp.]
MLKGLGALGDMTKMVKAAQEMQGKLAALQEELARIVVLGEAGGGAVKARATAKGIVTGLDIDPSLLDPAQKEVVEDLIIAAIRDAQDRGNERAQAEMARIADDLGLPPGMGMPG